VTQDTPFAEWDPEPSPEKASKKTRDEYQQKIGSTIRSYFKETHLWYHG
jgi:hypothetical protein